MNRLFWFVLALATIIGGLTYVGYQRKVIVNPPIQQPIPFQQVQPPAPLPPKIETPKIPNITVRMPEYLPYNKLVAQLDLWHKEAPDLTERGSYGETTRNQLLQYIRVTNVLDKSPKKVVLITACIHGNEPLSCGNVMALIGALLSDYGKDEAVTEIINTRDIYFIPVVSPDSYPSSRYVDGVDPNRNFPNPRQPSLQSIKPIKAIQDFVLKIKPAATISGHTWGRVMLTPWGDSMTPCPDHDQYQKVIGQMARLANYRIMRACDMYQGGGGINNPNPKVSIPIYGGEVDWYYRQGSFAVVMEMGEHQRIPTLEDISLEHRMTYKALKFFLKEAPNVQLKQK